MEKSIFLNGEGDQYLRRNLSKLNAEGIAQDVHLFARYLQPGSKVLEMGCVRSQAKPIAVISYL